MWGMGIGHWEPEDREFQDFSKALQDEEQLSTLESWEHTIGDATFKLSWAMQVFPSPAGGSIFQCRLAPDPGLLTIVRDDPPDDVFRVANSIAIGQESVE
jgi:hypothetical protein